MQNVKAKMELQVNGMELQVNSENKLAKYLNKWNDAKQETKM